MNINVNIGLAGYFKLVRRKADTLEIAEETPWFPNIILDQGLERKGTGTIFGAAKVGTNNTTPATNQTALLGYLASTTTLQSSSWTAQSTAPYYGSYIVTYRFAAGVAAGVIAEVGIGWASGNATNTLWNRALVLDINGNPTTITVLSDEVLDVVYELRMYPALTDVVAVYNISGVDYTVTTRSGVVTNSTAWGLCIPNAAGRNASSGNIIAYNGTLGAITSSPSGNTSAMTSSSTNAYTPGSQSIVINSTWGLDQGNLSGGISAVSVPTTLGYYQFGFSPSIPKTSDATLTLSFSFTWARHTI